MSPSGPDKLAGVRAKVKWAKKHVAGLDAALRAFHASNPYKVGTKRDPQTRKLIYYVSGVDQTPDHIPLVAGDAISNLRGALDHLAFQLFLTGTGAARGPGRHVYFPVFDSASKYKAESPRKVQGLRPDAVEAINAVEPYQGGKGHQVWVLHELNNTHKHRLLVTVGSQLRSLNLGAHLSRSMQRQVQGLWGDDRAFPVVDFFIRPADPLCPLKAGDELFIDAADAEVDEKLEFRFDVALSEPQVPKGEPLLETLQKSVQLVEGVVVGLAPFV